MLGASLSLILSAVCVRVLLFPAASTTVQACGGYTDWEGRSWRVASKPMQPARLVGSCRGFQGLRLQSNRLASVMLAVMFDGQAMLGASLSVTVTDLLTRCAVSSGVNYSPSHGELHRLGRLLARRWLQKQRCSCQL